MELGLKGKTAIITGAAGGIGGASARALAELGCNVVLADLRADQLSSLNDALTRQGVQTLAIECDVARRESVRAMVSAAVNHLGRVDVLVNNAGIFQSKPLDQLELEEWNRMLEVNLTGAFNCVQAVLPTMKTQLFGRIINIGSLAGQVGGNNGGAHYAASKAGLISLTKSLAKSTGAYGINVNCINPGYINTEVVRTFPAAILDSFVKGTPLGRLGSPEEVASVVVFLASTLSTFIHGAQIDVNGGFHLS